MVLRAVLATSLRAIQGYLLELGQCVSSKNGSHGLYSIMRVFVDRDHPIMGKMHGSPFGRPTFQRRLPTQDAVL